LKNSFRAVIESYEKESRKYSSRKEEFDLPEIRGTIAVNRTDFTIRISDRGKGITPDAMRKIFDYHFTTSGKKNRDSGGMPNLNPNYDDKGLAGYGIGLPVSRAYAEYLGGSLQIKPLHGIGSDVYLTLKHIEQPDTEKSIRI